MDQTQIADYLAKKVFDGELNTPSVSIMLKNKQIYGVIDYSRLVKSNKISPQDAFVYIDSENYSLLESYNHPADYLFPLINSISNYIIVKCYLAKLGFYSPYDDVFPATGLKYFAVVVLFKDRLVIELTDIDTVATNTRLRKIVMKVLGTDLLTQEEIDIFEKDKIADKLEKQKLFAGYTPGRAYFIVGGYYKKPDTSLAKEVLTITNAYNRVFEPYRVVYDTRTRRQVLM